MTDDFSHRTSKGTAAVLFNAALVRGAELKHVECFEDLLGGKRIQNST